MPLTDTALRNAKPGPKPVRLFDGGGLYVEISTSGGKWWRLKYRYGGKEKRISLGVYPDVSLKEARQRRDTARKLLGNGVDPGKHRKAEKAAFADRQSNSFEVVAREWHEKYSHTWARSHSVRVLRLFERDIFPWIGSSPVSRVTAPELLSVLRRIENRGALDTAHRAHQSCGQVFRYAVATGRADRDPSGDLKGALPPVKGGHFAATTDPNRFADILKAMDGYEGSLVVRSALHLAPLVFVRPGELRTARWEDFDLEAAEWRFIVSKTRTQHVVPLSRQAMSILSELHPLTGHGRFVFPGARGLGRPISDNALLVAMRTMNITREDMTVHGFRAVARTILDEVLGYRPDIIEHQLAHAVRDPNGRAYNRTAHLSERREMMQRWADYLGRLKEGGAVSPMRRVHGTR